MITIQGTQEEADRWAAHLKASKRAVVPGTPVPFLRKQKALNLYLQTRNKSHVCSKMHMGRHTLNNILRAAGVV
ncbi:hypothetical protein V7O66_08030 [Methanolobus sp. ZRKC3]|uniref:hypothetical protein n=1 Tax=Methanolobus sp. ZRKC3 TaxID=3125786 RepID=UPI00324A99FC